MKAGVYDQPLYAISNGVLVPLPKASVQVKKTDGSLAKLYGSTTMSLASEVPNPTQSDDAGNLRFFAAIDSAGYDLVVTPAGGSAQAPYRVRVGPTSDVAADIQVSPAGALTETDAQAALAGLETRKAPINANRVHVNSKGADPTGAVNSHAAIDAAQLALPASGGRLEFGIGTYLVGDWLRTKRSNVLWKGEHMDATTLRASAATVRIIGASVAAHNLTFEDITFDGANILTDLTQFLGQHNRNVTFRRCRFTGVDNPSITQGTISIYYTQVQGLTVEDCVFDGRGTGKGRGIFLTGGGVGARIRRNKFRWLHDGILVDTGAMANAHEQALRGLSIRENEFEGGWFLLLSAFTGEGGTVTYANPSGTQITVTDTAAAFTGISGTDTTVRVMPVLSTGTIGNLMTDQTRVSGTGFAAAGVRRGDIIRCGTAMAVVEAQESDTVVRHEGWLTEADRQPTTTPAVGTAWTIYRLWVGRITAFTATSLTVDRLHDWQGTTILPPTLAAGTRYEVSRKRPNYQLVMERGVRGFDIVGNHFLRGWSDQIGVQGCRRGLVAENVITDGQDFGITVDVNSEDVDVGMNVIDHQGSGGIFLRGARHRASRNRVIDSAWRVTSATADTTGDIEVAAADDVTVEHNDFHRLSNGASKYGVNVHAKFSVACNRTVLRGNSAGGHLTADYRVEGGATTTATKLRDNRGSISIDATVGPVDFGVREGTGSPEAAVTGSVGDQWRRTDGGAGTTLYVKESGNNTNTGWVAK